jgi:hypothetical protein
MTEIRKMQPLRRSLPKQLGIVLLLFAGLVAALALANLSGFCLKQLRFLSDDAAVDAAIAHVIARQNSRIVTRTPDEPVVRVRPYESVAQFKALNPGCCRIVPHNSGLEVRLVTLAHRLWGDAAKSVSIVYTRHYVDVDGTSKSDVAKAQPVISNCGKALNLGS